MNLICVLFLISCSYAATVQRTDEELLKYREFLASTINGKPTEPLAPELANLQNEWERSGKFEGDISLTDDQIEGLVEEYSGVKNALRDRNKLWLDKVIVYEITNEFTESQLKAIHDAIADIEILSCVKFKNRTEENDYIQVTNDDEGCYSFVGRHGGVQQLNLGTNCFIHGTIVHEFLHAIGFYHMQSTYNRDDWVKIIWKNIIPESKFNFIKYNIENVTNLGVKYDYGSVMHYGTYAFTKNGERTIKPIKPTYGIIIGQRKGMSPSDIIKLNKLYKCPGY